MGGTFDQLRKRFVFVIIGAGGGVRPTKRDKLYLLLVVVVVFLHSRV
jgi:hypothetical protein